MHTDQDPQSTEAIWKRFEVVIEERPRLWLHPTVAFRRQPEGCVLWLEELAYSDLEISVESTGLDAEARVADLCDLLFVEVGYVQSALRFHPRIWKCWTLKIVMKLTLKKN